MEGLRTSSPGDSSDATGRPSQAKRRRWRATGCVHRCGRMHTWQPATTSSVHGARPNLARGTLAPSLPPSADQLTVCAAVRSVPQARSCGVARAWKLAHSIMKRVTCACRGVGRQTAQRPVLRPLTLQIIPRTHFSTHNPPCPPIPIFLHGPKQLLNSVTLTPRVTCSPAWRVPCGAPSCRPRRPGYSGRSDGVCSSQRQPSSAPHAQAQVRRRVQHAPPRVAPRPTHPPLAPREAGALPPALRCCAAQIFP